MTDALLLTYHLTRDERYLQPLRSMAAMRMEWVGRRGEQAPEPGSRLWCGSKLGFLAGTLAKHKLLTGSGEFDDLLARDGAATLGASDDPQNMRFAQSLRQTAEALAINFPGRTSEVRWTDRVFAFARLFGDDMLFPQAVPACSVRPDLTLLYATATGDRGNFLVFPMNAVRWLTEPRDIAALVTERGHDRFSAELFHFGERSRAMGAELYLLTNGRYTLTIEDDGGHAIVPPVSFTVDGPRTRIAFELPSQKRCVLKVTRAGD
jgi:hypothetical protein